MPSFLSAMDHPFFPPCPEGGPSHDSFQPSIILNKKIILQSILQSGKVETAVFAALYYWDYETLFNMCFEMDYEIVDKIVDIIIKYKAWRLAISRKDLITLERLINHKQIDAEKIYLLEGIRSYSFVVKDTAKIAPILGLCKHNIIEGVDDLSYNDSMRYLFSSSFDAIWYTTLYDLVSFPFIQSGKPNNIALLHKQSTIITNRIIFDCIRSKIGKKELKRRLEEIARDLLEEKNFYALQIIKQASHYLANSKIIEKPKLPAFSCEIVPLSFPSADGLIQLINSYNLKDSSVEQIILFAEKNKKILDVSSVINEKFAGLAEPYFPFKNIPIEAIKVFLNKEQIKKKAVKKIKKEGFKKIIFNDPTDWYILLTYLDYPDEVYEKFLIIGIYTAQEYIKQSKSLIEKNSQSNFRKIINAFDINIDLFTLNAQLE
jgi:hypothetical protein